jgi:hypothetical protein
MTAESELLGHFALCKKKRVQKTDRTKNLFESAQDQPTQIRYFRPSSKIRHSLG